MATQSQDDRRARLRDAALHEVAHKGYAQTKVRDIATRAGVTTRTFYALYVGKEQCLLDALCEARTQLRRETERALAGAHPSAAAKAALDAIVDYAATHQDSFYALTHEALYAGARAASQRDALVAALEWQIEAAVCAAPASAKAPDIPAMILISGTIRTLGLTIRRGSTPDDLRSDLGRWAQSYTLPVRLHRWRSFTPDAALLSPQEPLTSAPVEPLPRRGRTPAAGAALRHAQRERILAATAHSAQLKGYERMTVADIVVAAGLSREVFYTHFHSKRDAFIAVVMQGYEQAIGACARAFFMSERSWPERVWDANQATAEFLATNPGLAYAILVEGYVLGADIARTDEMMLSYTVFLEDGYRYRPQAAQTPRLVGEAIGGAALETIVQMTRQGRTAELPSLLPLSTYTMLAPFTGTKAATQVVDRRLAEYKANHKTAHNDDEDS